MWSDLATIGKATFEFWASPRTNPLGSWMVEPYRPILRATGMLPDTHLQNLRWLPGRGTADYSRWLSQIREGFVAEGGFPVVVLDTGRFMPKGLAAELRNNIGFPVPGVGTVRSPLAFADSYQDWVRTLINDAIGRQTPGGFITTPSPFSVPGAIPPYDRVPSTLVQDMRRGQELAPVPHIDDALAITASLTAEGTGTMYESRAHYLERAGAKRPPRAEDMAPASRNLGDIVLHSGSAFPGKGGGVYHRSPTSAEWTGQQRLVALSSVTTREQAAAARAQVMRMIRENIARQR